ncbi:MAG: hypothetical protein ABSF90_07830 [Syntrophobacteraceae bacterium]
MTKKKRKTSPNPLSSYFLDSHTRPRTYTQFPNSLLYRIIRSTNHETALFLLICRMTLGFYKKDIQGYRLCWKWPPCNEIAKILGIPLKGARPVISRAKGKLIKSRRILEWIIGRDRYVGPNYALMNVTSDVTMFLKEHHYIRIDHERWYDAIESFADEHGVHHPEVFQRSIERFEHAVQMLEQIQDANKQYVNILGEVIEETEMSEDLGELDDPDTMDLNSDNLHSYR